MKLTKSAQNKLQMEADVGFEVVDKAKLVWFEEIFEEYNLIDELLAV
ncbi:Uncharacterised protein [Streptococcus pneumoniae]|nr:Uncharacterised protein [Streptococcus pneumoniae]